MVQCFQSWVVRTRAFRSARQRRRRYQIKMPGAKTSAGQTPYVSTRRNVIWSGSIVFTLGAAGGPDAINFSWPSSQNTELVINSTFVVGGGSDTSRPFTCLNIGREMNVSARLRPAPNTTVCAFVVSFVPATISVNGERSSVG